MAAPVASAAPPISKAETAETLRTIHAAFAFGVMTLDGDRLSAAWLARPAVSLTLPDAAGVNRAIDLGRLKALLADRGTRDGVTQETAKMLKRGAAQISFETVQLYLFDIGKPDLIKSEGVLQYALVLRDTASHRKAEVLVWPGRLKRAGIAEVNWNERRFRQTDEFQPIEVRYLDVFELIEELIRRVETDW